MGPDSPINTPSSMACSYVAEGNFLFGTVHLPGRSPYTSTESHHVDRPRWVPMSNTYSSKRGQSNAHTLLAQSKHFGTSTTWAR